MPMYPYRCPKCEDEFNITMTIAEYSEFEEFECPICGHANVTRDDRIMCAPSVTRASYVMGTKRPGFAERKEVLKLRSQSYNMRPEDRTGIRREIRNIEGGMKND